MRKLIFGIFAVALVAILLKVLKKVPERPTEKYNIVVKVTD